MAQIKHESYTFKHSNSDRSLNSLDTKVAEQPDVRKNREQNEQRSKSGLLSLLSVLDVALGTSLDMSSTADDKLAKSTDVPLQKVLQSFCLRLPSILSDISCHICGYLIKSEERKVSTRGYTNFRENKQ